MHFERLVKIGEFLCSHFNIEDGGRYTHFQCIMLYHFKKGKNATEAEKNCAVHGEGAVIDRTCQKWFAMFLGTIGILAK